MTVKTGIKNSETFRTRRAARANNLRMGVSIILRQRPATPIRWSRQPRIVRKCRCIRYAERHAVEPLRSDAPVVARSLPADARQHKSSGCIFKGAHSTYLRNFCAVQNHSCLLPELNRRVWPHRRGRSNAARATIRLSAAARSRSPLGATSTTLNSSSMDVSRTNKEQRVNGRVR
jgi:hypothetical protein